MWRTMFYPKNVPNVERVIRIIVGVGMSALLLSGHTLLGPISVVGAAFWIFTGFFGWCPACALIGRKIKRNTSQPTPTA